MIAVRNKILVLYYSQSGQLRKIVDQFIEPFTEKGVGVEVIQVKPKVDFPFPWTSDSFFDTMPESVLGIPVDLEPIHPKEIQYSLVVLAYQPWFLSPSIPTISFLENIEVQKILKNTPVITLIGARNMWLNAHEKLKVKLRDLGAKLVGNIVLTDQHQNHISAVTILHWMLSGKKDRFLGIFPLPGISESDISKSKQFGNFVASHFESGNWEGLQAKLIEARAVEVKSDLMFIEHRARRLFSIWANLIKSKKNRGFWVTAYKYYLLIALFIVAPLVLIINNIFFRPFFQKVIKRKKQYYLGLN